MEAALYNFVTYNEKCETFTNWKSKKRYQQINFVQNIQEVEALFWTLAALL